MDQTGFIRKFQILAREDNLKLMKDASGYIRFDIRGNDINIVSYIQNVVLRSVSEMQVQLYAVAPVEQGFVTIFIGEYNANNNGIELRRDAKAVDFLGSGCNFDSIEVFAVAIKDSDRGGFLFPFAVKRKDIQGWKEAINKCKLEGGHLPDPKTEDQGRKSNGPANNGIVEAKGPINETSQKDQMQNNESNTVSSKPTEYRSNLGDIFRRRFTACRPFSEIKPNYYWWKIEHPSQINDLFENVDSRKFFYNNANVTLPHCKYGHLIAGTYTDKKMREFLIFGIPGIFGIDEKPFGTACRWIPVYGVTKKITQYGRNGEFGYWVIYINPKTGRLQSV